MECEHKNMSPYMEDYETLSGRLRKRDIWFCNTYGCNHKELRERLNLYCEEEGSIDTADDIRVINIIANNLGIGGKQAHELLKNATEENPIIYQGDIKFWNEKS